MNPFDLSNLNHLFESQSGHSGRMKRRESSTLEIKENFNLSNDSKALYGKTMAGFANNEGGYILFGVKDQPHEMVGMSNHNFAQLDPKQLQQFLSEYFAPAIDWRHYHHQLEERHFGLIYVYPARSKPVVCIKHGHKDLRDGDIYFRYQGETRRVKSAELHQIIADRVAIERLSWQAFLRDCATINPASRIVIDTTNGEGSSGGRRFMISEALLEKINFIQEGRFSEEGDRVLRVVGDVDVVRPEAMVVETGIPQDISPDYPFPTNKLVSYVNKVLGQSLLTASDVATVLKRIHDVENRPDWYYRNKVMHSAPQYSQAYADWIVDQIRSNAAFLATQRQIERDIRAKRNSPNPPKT